MDKSTVVKSLPQLVVIDLTTII
eukprot:COSAG06_NODE_3217_length_5659_cov_2.688825_3_plen_22_part_01